MVLRINFSLGQPPHLQIIDQVKAAAASGALRPGEALPSIGPLALQLRINRNVIAKAYSELETIGLIEALPSGGDVLKQQSVSRNESRRKLLVTDAQANAAQNVAIDPRKLKQSLITIGIATLYLGTLGILVAVFHGAVDAVLLIVILGAVFMPLERRLQQFVERSVFAKRYELPRALEAIKSEVLLQPDLDSFIEHVIEKIQIAMGCPVEWIQEYADMLTLVNAHPVLRSARVPAQSGSD